MKFIPTASQTVGPFFSIGLAPLSQQEPEAPESSKDKITIRGTLCDADRSPIPDALLEFWGAKEFARVPTSEDGTFVVSPVLPAAQYFDILIFMRGLMKPVYTRLFLGERDAALSDPILKLVPSERIATLFAATDGSPNHFVWNVVMQGENETVFFEF
jgi:protocatechuate 3,4-dioxygenase alpha subunit